MINFKPSNPFPNLIHKSGKTYGEKQGMLEANELPPREIGSGLYKQRWYSLCSRHRNGDKDCSLCRIGRYHNVFKDKIEYVIYKLFPSVWRWWVNR